MGPCDILEDIRLVAREYTEFYIVIAAEEHGCDTLGRRSEEGELGFARFYVGGCGPRRGVFL